MPYLSLARSINSFFAERLLGWFVELLYFECGMYFPSSWRRDAPASRVLWSTNFDDISFQGFTASLFWTCPWCCQCSWRQNYDMTCAVMSDWTRAIAFSHKVFTCLTYPVSLCSEIRALALTNGSWCKFTHDFRKNKRVINIWTVFKTNLGVKRLGRIMKCSKRMIFDACPTLSVHFLSPVSVRMASGLCCSWLTQSDAWSKDAAHRIDSKIEATKKVTPTRHRLTAEIECSY